MIELPEPPVPATLDLRDFRWMKLDLIALFNSNFNATIDDTAWRAGVTLWGRAWHQVPAGSLPNDDGTLCNLAGLGRDIKTWKKIRKTALHGFHEASDGRLYHTYVCKMALDADEERRRFEDRRAKDRERKKGSNSTETPQETPQEIQNNSSGNPVEFAVEGQGQGQGQGQKERTPDGVPKKAPDPRGSRLPDGFEVSAEMREWAVENGLTCGVVSNETAKFVDYWKSKPGADGRKTDWNATWRNWMRKSFAGPTPKPSDLGRAWI